VGKKDKFTCCSRFYQLEEFFLGTVPEEEETPLLNQNLEVFAGGGFHENWVLVSRGGPFPLARDTKGLYRLAREIQSTSWPSKGPDAEPRDLDHETGSGHGEGQGRECYNV
jgi:hypothetical protein